jgi:hypothetical protein
MNTNFSDSIILVTSIDPNYSGNFGTGFVIHQYEQTTYVLTCAHVVRDVGGADNVKADGHRAKVETSLGDVEGCDLAVLAVENGLTKLTPLKLGVVGEKGREFIVSGCYTDGAKARKLAPISGKLGGTQIIMKEGDRTPAWNLEISDDSEHELKPGYSGSPVVDKASGYVLGVVAQLTGQGKGLAISIEALGKVWQTDDLVITKISSSEKPKIESDMKEIDKEIERIQKLIDAKVSNRDNLNLSIEYFRGINPVAVLKYEAEVKQIEEEISQLQTNQQKLIQKMV